MRKIVNGSVATREQIRPFQRWDTPLSALVCSEVLYGDSYPLLPLMGPIKVIVDVGANVGASTVYFAVNYRESRIVAIEPDPDCFTLLEANTKDLPNVVCNRLALSDHDGSQTLYQGTADSVLNSLHRHNQTERVGPTVMVKDARAFLESVETARVDILKLDTEGSEPEILESLLPVLPQIGLVYVEYHSEAGRREIDLLLQETHLLWQGKARCPHRGELAYALPSRIPAEARQPAIPPAVSRYPRPFKESVE